MNYLDYEVTEAFDPQNLENWLLVASIIGMLILSYASGMRQDAPMEE